MFSETGFQFSMRFERGDPAAYFAPGEQHERLLEERRRWLNESPSTYAAFLPECEPLLRETLDLANAWDPSPDRASPGADSLESLLSLACSWEPDFLLLKPTNDALPTLLGGSVCFPSSWSLEEKMGESIDFIHAVVPGLNDSIGDKVRNFLNRLRPGAAWLRANWGLSRSGELNQHPSRDLPRLDAAVPLEEVWLRVERQALVALPESGGVLFGIRIETNPLSALREDAAAMRGLARDLETMPQAMAEYKNIAAIRERIVEWLRASDAPDSA